MRLISYLISPWISETYLTYLSPISRSTFIKLFQTKWCEALPKIINSCLARTFADPVSSIKWIVASVNDRPPHFLIVLKTNFNRTRWELIVLFSYSNYINMYVLIRSQTVGAAMSRTAPTAIPFVVLLLFCFCLLFFCAILLHAPLLFCCYSAIDLCAAMQNRISTDTATEANLGHTDKQAATYTHECFFLLHLTQPSETKV